MTHAFGLILSFFNDHRWTYVMMIILFVFGMIGGAINALLVDEITDEKLSIYLGDLVGGEVRDGGDGRSVSLFPESFRDAFASFMMNEGVVPWMMAFTILLFPIMLGLQFMHGHAIGFLTIMIVKNWSFLGAFYVVSGLLPHHALVLSGRWIVMTAALSVVGGGIHFIKHREPFRTFRPTFIVSHVMVAIGMLLIAMGLWLRIVVSPEILRITIHSTVLHGMMN